MKSVEFFALLEIAEHVNSRSTQGSKMSTAQLAKKLMVSQQTASRIMRSLEFQNLVQRIPSSTGTILSVSEKGKNFLKKTGKRAVSLASCKTGNELLGLVCDGLGEGAYYTSRPSYVLQFKKLLGFKPFKGTLNIKVEEHEAEHFLRKMNPVKIDGFKTGERSFGKIDAFPVLVGKGIEAAVLVPERSSLGKKILEIVSPVFLRKKLSLENGDKIKISDGIK